MFVRHEGTKRHSGRYPYGSGENPNQHTKSFTSMVTELRKSGMSDVEVYKALGLSSTSELRSRLSIAKSEEKKEQRAQAIKLREKGMSYPAIAERLGMANESSVRELFKENALAKVNKLEETKNILRENVKQKEYLDVGLGTEAHLNMSRERLRTAIKSLEEEEGYKLHRIKDSQVGSMAQNTNLLVLTAGDKTTRDCYQNASKIKAINDTLVESDKTRLGINPPVQINSKRLQVKYGPEGGAEKDGVIELRRGAEDLSLGNSRYCQVRIAVDGTHYLKGMAVYADDLPPGVDLRFNTNKKNTGNKLDALKPLKDDEDNPFGATVRQRTYTDKHGKEHQSPLNIVHEEGDWGKWSKTLSSQMLSKQPVKLAERQLKFARDKRQADYDEIMALTNPVVKKKLLASYADKCDSAAVDLKAAAMPRQKTHVILPFPSIKDREIYAPNYDDGDTVVLIRFPHGGKFEIPELTVNNKNRDARRVIGDAIDAVGINHKVAERLSGADFDGDTVLVIPNKSGAIKTQKALTGLKDFDPKAMYKLPPDAPPSKRLGVTNDGRKDKHATGREMGNISNLITDMTIKGASTNELTRAVRHSMVVIDAEKHGLDYRQSAIDNDIASLKKKYQRGASSGASTLLSLSTSADRQVLDRKPRPAAEGGPIDPKTGKKVYVETGATRVTRKTKADGTVVEEVVPVYNKVQRGALVDDAFKLSSGTRIESVYANHANELKALANRARKEYLRTKPPKMDRAAAKAYAEEVKLLDAKLNKAMKQRPQERQAQIIAKQIIALKIQENPAIKEEGGLKRMEYQALMAARHRVGLPKKYLIDIEPREWEAIQAGAVSPTKLEKILDNTDLKTIQKYATPKTATVLSASKKSRIKAMSAAGYTQAEIAQNLGVSVSTVLEYDRGGE